MSVVYAGMILPEFGMCRNQNKPATISCSAAISDGNILKTTNKTMIEKKNPNYCSLGRSEQLFIRVLEKIFQQGATLSELGTLPTIIWIFFFYHSFVRRFQDITVGYCCRT